MYNTPPSERKDWATSRSPTFAHDVYGKAPLKFITTRLRGMCRGDGRVCVNPSKFLQRRIRARTPPFLRRVGRGGRG